MCGIAGYIGQSKKPKLTFELITQLFDYLEVRGMDAAGVWGTEQGEGGRVIYHKEPIRSSEFVKKSFWQQQVRKLRTNLLLVHARAASKGGGLPTVNENNHPFVSTDKRIGMVHNGTLDEIDFLKNRYETVSQTDSEVLLRMYEHGLERDPLELEADEEISSRMVGIKDIWSVISTGAMSVALGERVDDFSRFLFLFRNFRRPLWIADVRDLLGQVFFFSSPDVWYRAISSSEVLKKVSGSAQKLIEIPPDQVWVLQIDQEYPMMLFNNQIQRFEIETKVTDKEWEAGSRCEVPKAKVELDVVSVIADPPKPKTTIIPSPSLALPAPTEYPSASELLLDNEPDTQEEIDPSGMSVMEPNGPVQHQDACEQIIELVHKIETAINNALIDSTMTEESSEYTDVVNSLDITKADLEGTLALLGGSSK